jgi:hypothetical protein
MAVQVYQLNGDRLQYFGADGITRQPPGLLQSVVSSSNFTGANSATAQPWFAAANDAFTAAANSLYSFDGLLCVTNGGTTCTKGVLFGGTATISTIRYNSIANAQTTLATLSTAPTTAVSGVATNFNVLATGTQAQWYVYIKGMMRISTGGTIIPQFIFSADPTGTVTILNLTYFNITKLGSDTYVADAAWG